MREAEPVRRVLLEVSAAGIAIPAVESDEMEVIGEGSVLPLPLREQGPELPIDRAGVNSAVRRRPFRGRLTG